jgi:hypothetical protein
VVSDSPKLELITDTRGRLTSLSELGAFPNALLNLRKKKRGNEWTLDAERELTFERTRGSDLIGSRSSAELMRGWC